MPTTGRNGKTLYYLPSVTGYRESFAHNATCGIMPSGFCNCSGAICNEAENLEHERHIKQCKKCNGRIIVNGKCKNCENVVK